jgi:hypothetical protein
VQLGVRRGEADEVAQDQAQARGEVDAFQSREAPRERLGEQREDPVGGGAPERLLGGEVIGARAPPWW